MLHIETGIQPFALSGVFPVASVYVFPFAFVKFVAVGCTQDPVPTDIGPDGSLSECPSGVRVERTAIHVGDVIVFAGTGTCLPPDELVVVVESVPISGRRNLDLLGKTVDACRYSPYDMAGLFPLVVVLGRVKRVGTIVLSAHSQLPCQIHVRRSPDTVVVQSSLVEVAVWGAAI